MWVGVLFHKSLRIIWDLYANGHGRLFKLFGLLPWYGTDISIDFKQEIYMLDEMYETMAKYLKLTVMSSCEM